MKRVKLFLICLFFPSLMVLAQNSDFNIQLQKIAGSTNWKMDMQLNMGLNTGSGIVLELPAGVHSVPVSIKIDDKEFWLKESGEPVTNDSIIHWERTDSTLVLRFNSENTLQSGMLYLDCMAQVSSKTNGDVLFTAKSMVNNNSQNLETIATTNVNIAQ